MAFSNRARASFFAAETASRKRGGGAARSPREDDMTCASRTSDGRVEAWGCARVECSGENLWGSTVVDGSWSRCCEARRTSKNRSNPESRYPGIPRKKTLFQDWLHVRATRTGTTTRRAAEQSSGAGGQQGRRSAERVGFRVGVPRGPSSRQRQPTNAAPKMLKIVPRWYDAERQWYSS